MKEQTKSILAPLLSACVIISFQACAPNGPVISELGTPKLVPQSQPDSSFEAGIGQEPGTGGMFLQWYRTPGAAGYKVYRSDSTDLKGAPVGFQNIGNVISSSSLNDTSMVDVAAWVGITYYYCLKGYSADGRLSNPSDTVNYTLLGRPSPRLPKSGDTVALQSVDFGWVDNTGGGYTVIRVRSISPLPPSLVWVSKRFVSYHSYSAREFNCDSTAIDQLVRGRSYQWRVDRFNVDGNGRPFEGSRSAWSAFTVK